MPAPRTRPAPRTSPSTRTRRTAVALAAAALLFGLLAVPRLPAQWLENGCRATATANGTANRDLFGWRVRRLDDVDRDGVVDFAVAAPFHNLNVGRVSVHSGADGARLWQRDETRVSSILGFSLATVRDLDGDGIREVLAGAPFHNRAGGFVHVYSGRTGATVHTFAGPAQRDSLGYSVATGGDFDGDGTDDLALGATGSDATGANAGRVFVHSTNGFGQVATIDPPNAGDARFGTGLAFVGDVDGDRRDDLAVAVRLQSGQPPGRIQLIGFDGSAPRLIRTIDGVELGQSLDGPPVDSGADLDGDGIQDVFVGESNVSRARVFSGATGAVVHTFQDTANDRLGIGGAGIVEDVNGDGIADVLVGARLSSVGAASAGRLLLFSGRDGRRLREMTFTLASWGFGADADILGDVDGDGALDIVAGAMGGGPSNGPGRAFVLAGDPCLAARRAYGAGLAGTNGVPALGADRDPVFGAVPRIEVGNSAGNATNALLAFGTARGALPTPWGGTLLVAPLLVSPLALPASGATLPLPVPAGAPCAVLTIQALELDPGAPGGVSETRGLELHLGR